jgi:hypothetical protein
MYTMELKNDELILKILYKLRLDKALCTTVFYYACTTIVKMYLHDKRYDP